MGVSCDCGFDEYDYYYISDNDLTKLQATKMKRCKSCKTLINIGDDVLKFSNIRESRTEIEERIWGDEVSLADSYMCEECAGLYWALLEKGLCISLIDGETMRELVDEYNREYR